MIQPKLLFKKILSYLASYRIKILLLVISVIGFGILFVLWQQQKKIILAKPKMRPVVEALYALGTIKAENIYNLRFGMNSQIKNIFVREGDQLLANAPLLLTDTGLVLRAPYAGTVTKVYFKTGEMASANQIILTLTDLKKLYVIASLDQESILQIKKDQTVELSFEMLREKKAHGKVTAIYPSGTEFLVRIDTDNLPPEVLPEMTCDAAIQIQRSEKKILIPKVAVEKGRVSLIRNNQDLTIPVKTGNTIGNMIEIIDGTVQVTDLIKVGSDKWAKGESKKR